MTSKRLSKTVVEQKQTVMAFVFCKEQGGNDHVGRFHSSSVSVVGTPQRNADVSLYMLDLGGDVTGNGISKLVFTIPSAVAVAERDRIRDVKADQKVRRRYLGGRVPFGPRLVDDGELIEAPDQQAAIARMMAMLHPVHVHSCQLGILSLNDTTPPAHFAE